MSEVEQRPMFITAGYGWCNSQWDRDVCVQNFAMYRFSKNVACDVSNTIVSSGYPNTEKRVENMMCSGVFLTKFEVFGL